MRFWQKKHLAYQFYSENLNPFNLKVNHGELILAPYGAIKAEIRNGHCVLGNFQAESMFAHACGDRPLSIQNIDQVM